MYVYKLKARNQGIQKHQRKKKLGVVNYRVKNNMHKSTVKTLTFLESFMSLEVVRGH